MPVVRSDLESCKKCTDPRDVAGAKAVGELDNNLLNLGKIKNLTITSNHKVTRKQYVQIGNLLTLDFEIQLTSDVSAWESIGKISKIPVNNSAYCPCIIDASIGFIYVKGDGTLAIPKDLSSGKYIYGTITFIIK